MKIKSHTIVLFTLIAISNLVNLVLYFIYKQDLEEAFEGFRKAGYIVPNIGAPITAVTLISISIYLLLYFYINRNSVKALVIYFIFMVIALIGVIGNIASLRGLEPKLEKFTKLTDETYHLFLGVVDKLILGLGVSAVIVFVSAIYTFTLIKQFRQKK